MADGHKVYTDADFEVVGPSEVPHDFADLDKLGVINICGVDRDGRPTIIVAASRFPNNNSKEHDQLLKYIKYKLDDYVENDYCVIYFHYGYNKDNKPSFAWIKNAYKEFDRKYKKNIKKLIVVHPTSWMKTIWTMLRPFISFKFSGKLTYVNNLTELEEWVWLNQISIPVDVKNYDKSKLADMGEARIEDASTLAPQSQFGVELDILLLKQGSIPQIPNELVTFLSLERNMTTEGIFRRSASNQAVRDSQAIYNQGRSPIDQFNDPILPAALLKLWFRCLPQPLIPDTVLPEMAQMLKTSPDQKIEMLRKNVIGKVQSDHQPLLKFLLQFLNRVSRNESSNKMGSTQLAIVFGPALCWTESSAESLLYAGHINNMIKWLIDHCERVFTDL